MTKINIPIRVLEYMPSGDIVKLYEYIRANNIKYLRSDKLNIHVILEVEEECDAIELKLRFGL